MALYARAQSRVLIRHPARPASKSPFWLTLNRCAQPVDWAPARPCWNQLRILANFIDVFCACMARGLRVRAAVDPAGRGRLLGCSSSEAKRRILLGWQVPPVMAGRQRRSQACGEALDGRADPGPGPAGACSMPVVATPDRPPES